MDFSLPDTDSLFQQLLDVAMQTVKESLTSAIDNITKRQETFEENSCKRLNYLCSQISDIASNLDIPTTPKPTTSQDIDQVSSQISPKIQNSQTRDPNTSHQVPDSQISPAYHVTPRPSAIASSSLPRNDDPYIDSASRTLGFHPITENCLDDDFSIVYKFMSDILKIDPNTVQNMHLLRAWHSFNSQTVYVEFSSIQECFILFKHLSNLSGKYRIFQYIPPSHRKQYGVLSKQAYQLRHTEPPNKTRIEFRNNNLELSVLKPGDKDWCRIPPSYLSNTVPPSSSPSSLPSPSSCPTSGSSPRLPPRSPPSPAMCSPHSLSSSSFSLDSVCPGTTSDLSPITQLDGASDELAVISGQNTHSSILSQVTPSLNAQYQLNKVKQVAKLVKDSAIDNFEVEVLDSGRNVNIKCNSGFYEAVAKPAFASLGQG